MSFCNTPPSPYKKGKSQIIAKKSLLTIHWTESNWEAHFNFSLNLRILGWSKKLDHIYKITLLLQIYLIYLPLNFFRCISQICDYCFLANLCEYFVSIHGQHKIRGIRNASSTSCCRLSHFLSSKFTIAITK